MSSPRTCSKSFLLVLLEWSKAESCSLSLRVLSGVSSISKLKLIDHPHHVRQFLELYFFPGDERADGCEENDHQGQLMMCVWAVQRGQKVIYKQPSSARVARQDAVQKPEQERSCALPPMCGEASPKWHTSGFSKWILFYLTGS